MGVSGVLLDEPVEDTTMEDAIMEEVPEAGVVKEAAEEVTEAEAEVEFEPEGVY